MMLWKEALNDTVQVSSLHQLSDNSETDETQFLSILQPEI